eukprot:6056146-Pyramimonas_sp.AAC.2
MNTHAFTRFSGSALPGVGSAEGIQIPGLKEGIHPKARTHTRTRTHTHIPIDIGPFAEERNPGKGRSTGLKALVRRWQLGGPASELAYEFAATSGGIAPTSDIPIEGPRLVGGRGIFLSRDRDWSVDAVYSY